jgi:hypothetical protein
MIGLLVSLGAMLIAAAGVARHIWLRRAQFIRQRRGRGSRRLEPAEDAENELET